MHLLALLDKPTSGTIKINGIDSTKLRARKLNQLRNQSFGFVFQQFFMNPNDSVLENVMLPLKIAGVRRKKRKELATKALYTVGLEERLKFKANDLSGGQKQRVCIARALVNDPSIIFADEPTGNLDSTTGDKIIKLLFDANKKGTTLIIVTHDEDLAKLCDRQVRIMDGEIVEDTGAKSQKSSKKQNSQSKSAKTSASSAKSAKKGAKK
jgi:putative ABC transport system ATP-binding protein